MKKFLPLNIGPFSWTMFGLQFFYLYQVAASNDMGGLSFSLWSLVLIPVSMFTVLLFFQFLSAAFSKSRWGMVAASFVGLAIYDLVIGYQFSSRDLANWSVIADNISSAFSMEAGDVILHSFDHGALWYLFGFLVLFFGFELRRRTVSRGRQEAPHFQKAIVAGVLYLVFVLLPMPSYDPLLNFFRSIYLYYQPSVRMRVKLPEGYVSTPVMSDSFLSGRFTDGAKPHVFLIVVESLNFSSLGKRANGHEVTPFMNRLRKEAVTVEPFYGNSIQTAKGHFATFFSTIPSISGKTYVKFPDLKIDSIASVLQRSGYRTLYFAAHHNRSFDNEAPFLEKRGYSEYLVVKPFLKPEDESSKMGGWGVEDRVFFKRFFDYFDTRLASESGRPQFVTLVTIANHFPFNKMQESRRVIFSKPGSIRENYANSIHLSDEGLKVFFEELDKRGLSEKSIVIVTGDHAFPLGEHGNYHLESGYHEESFRIPFFMVWKGHLKPEKINIAYSQMDIGPTILDVLGIKGQKTNFTGVSIFSKREHPLYLIQPYGKHLAVVRYPFKYRFYTATEHEFVYDLSRDPTEKHNLSHEISTKKLELFRKDLKHIYFNQEVMKRDRYVL
ncbi:MAG: DUF229 domain-containing protein [Candidatus Margulisbacteria bacterium]|nr:DUF229 domain-containing protein [Candidatus Margulisiibacteriota bacterium]